MLKLALLLSFCLVVPALAQAEEHAKESEAKEPEAKSEAMKTDAKKPVPGKKAAKKDAKKDGKKAAARADGLVIEDVRDGSGKEAKLGSKITVHYRGTLKNGKEFDSSYTSGTPITFELAEGRLIKGWTEGIPGMKEKGKRKLHIPYAMAYGERGTPDGTIPPKSDLDFEVELLEVK